YYQAAVAADANYVGATSALEPLTVNKANPGVSTIVHDSNHTEVAIGDIVAGGTSVHDKATVTGLLFPPTGSVNFTFYPNGTCTGTGTGAGSAALDGAGVAHPSAIQGPLGPGNYSFKASYAGDTNYNPNSSVCENFTVIQKSIVTNTELCTFDINPDTAGSQF